LCSSPEIRIEIKMHSKKIKINLFALTAISLISGGIYFPIWFLRRHIFLGNRTRDQLLGKWFFVAATLTLIVTTATRGWCGANLDLVESRFGKQVLETPAVGRNVFSEYLGNRFELERNILYTRWVDGILALLLIGQSFVARSAVNIHLRKAGQTQISLQLWLMSGLCFYIFFAMIGGNPERGLLWTNFPLIFLMQYKINSLPENISGLNQKTQKEND